VFAIPGSIHNPLARGCHALIRQGAKLVDSANQILEELGPQLGEFLADGADSAPEAVVPGPQTSDLDDDHGRLLACMGYDPIAPDEIVARTGMPAFEIASMLLLLELKGLVTSHPGGRYSLRAGPAAEET
jgi:DNA processing protein